MCKIEGSSLDPFAGTTTHAANQHEDLEHRTKKRIHDAPPPAARQRWESSGSDKSSDALESLCFDTSALKKRITNQIILIQELSWEAQDTTSAKEALRTLQEALEGWCAHRDLILKLQASGQTG